MCGTSVVAIKGAAFQQVNTVSSGSKGASLKFPWFDRCFDSINKVQHTISS